MTELELEFELYDDEEINPLVCSGICFDDMPLEQLFNPVNKKQSPTPVDIVDYWAIGKPLLPDEEGFVATLLSDNIEIVFETGKTMEAKLLFKKALDLEEYQHSPQQVMFLYALWGLSLFPDINEGLRYYVQAQQLADHFMGNINWKTINKWDRIRGKANFFYKKNYPDANITCHRTNYSKNIQYEIPPVTPEMLRERAVCKVLVSDFHSAEEMYNQLLGLRFEISGTLCHLARVYLMTKREPLAREVVEKAWLLRLEAKTYIVPRILFFKLLFSMIDKTNPKEWIGMLKTALNQSDVFMNWDIDMVILEIGLKLEVEDYLFLMDLRQVLSGNANKVNLDEYCLWSEQEVLPLL